jgi:hypothetical protein
MAGDDAVERRGSAALWPETIPTRRRRISDSAISPVGSTSSRQFARKLRSCTR